MRTATSAPTRTAPSVLTVATSPSTGTGTSSRANGATRSPAARGIAPIPITDPEERRQTCPRFVPGARLVLGQRQDLVGAPKVGSQIERLPGESPRLSAEDDGQLAPPVEIVREDLDRRGVDP